jgi:hypothetical protein
MDAIHTPLDRATRALGDLIEARITGNETKAKAAIDQMSFDLGATKWALRELHVDGLVDAIRGTDEAKAERRRRLIEHAAEVRSKAQETMVTVASGALALSVTFREALVQGSTTASWLLKLSWVAFVVCVVCVLIERFISSTRFVVHAVEGTSPTRPEKLMLATPHLLSQVGFTVGILALAAFGWVNL